MKVADILRIKGSVVKTVPPHETALLLSGQMRAEQIGALVVSRDGNSIEGIVSERDLAYGLATYLEQVADNLGVSVDDEGGRRLLA